MGLAVPHFQKLPFQATWFGLQHSAFENTSFPSLQTLPQLLQGLQPCPRHQGTRSSGPVSTHSVPGVCISWRAPRGSEFAIHLSRDTRTRQTYGYWHSSHHSLFPISSSGETQLTREMSPHRGLASELRACCALGQATRAPQHLEQGVLLFERVQGTCCNPSP